MTKIKMCGITNKIDALNAASLGIDMLGFVFYKKSKRYLIPSTAEDIINELPPKIAKVGVFVDEKREDVIKIAEDVFLDTLQFHGDETPEYCALAAQSTGLPVIKAFRVSDEKALEAMPQYLESVSYFLLDAYVAGEPGGTGEIFNWDIALKAKEMGKPVFLAGGLTPENVAQAIKIARPYAVDVSSGVEERPGKKDYRKIEAFIRAVKT